MRILVLLTVSGTLIISAMGCHLLYTACDALEICGSDGEMYSDSCDFSDNAPEGTTVAVSPALCCKEESGNCHLNDGKGQPAYTLHQPDEDAAVSWPNKSPELHHIREFHPVVSPGTLD